MPCISKVFEKIIYKDLNKCCTVNKLLNERNSGFKQNDSTVNQLIKMTHDIYTGLENKNDVCGVFLDVSKAFDKVWHQGLLFKLRRMGIEGNLLLLIESYLSGRRQRVVMNGSESDWKYINAGVPQ